MPTVTVRLSPHPGNVRTARLLCSALARRAGADGQTLEEIRLAVGEACARAVRLHQKHAPGTAVALDIDDGDGLRVAVSDVCDAALVVAADLSEVPAAAAAGDVVEGMALGIVQGLVEDCEIGAGPDGRGTTVTMVWRLPGDPPVSRETAAAAPPPG